VPLRLGAARDREWHGRSPGGLLSAAGRSRPADRGRGWPADGQHVCHRTLARGARRPLRPRHEQRGPAAVLRHLAIGNAGDLCPRSEWPSGECVAGVSPAAAGAAARRRAGRYSRVPVSQLPRASRLRVRARARTRCPGAAGGGRAGRAPRLHPPGQRAAPLPAGRYPTRSAGVPHAVSRVVEMPGAPDRELPIPVRRFQGTMLDVDPAFTPLGYLTHAENWVPDLTYVLSKRKGSLSWQRLPSPGRVDPLLYTTSVAGD